MKNNMLTILIIYASLSFKISAAYGNESIVARTTLPARQHETWAGIYRFQEESILKIDGFKDLHLLIYRNMDNKSTLIDFAESINDHELRILFKANANVKGVIPILEGIDVLPTNDIAEIIVRWKHHGHGGFRRVEKFSYSKHGIQLIARSEFLNIEGEYKWISETSLRKKAEEMSNAYPQVREVK